MKTSAIIVLVVLLLVNFALSKYKILVVMEALWEGDVEMYLKLFPEQLGADTEVRLMSDDLRVGWGPNNFISLDRTKSIKVSESFQKLSDAELNTFNAVILPAGYVTDNLLWLFPQEVQQGKVPEMSKLLIKVWKNPKIVKASICHGMLGFAATPQLIAGRNVTTNQNVVYSAKNCGARVIAGADIVVDNDLVTCRAGDLAEIFVTAIVQKIQQIQRNNY